MKDLTQLSREVSYALRHAPWEYELEIDCQGWVLVEQLLDALHESVCWADVTKEDLAAMIHQSDKKRHEMVDGRIRAFYGHSIPMKIIKEPQEPPHILYHGTAKRFLPSIIEYGLKHKSRQYVHLSQDIKTAKIVGKRRDSCPVILKINAHMAYQEGISFYIGNEKVWLADDIPPQYIEIL